MTILMETEAIHRGLVDVSLAEDALDSARVRATQRVDALLDGWRGDAAESFAAAYTQWAAAARAVLDELGDLRAGIAGARAAMGDSDSSTACRVARIADRLG